MCRHSILARAYLRVKVVRSVPALCSSCNLHWSGLKPTAYSALGSRAGHIHPHLSVLGLKESDPSPVSPPSSPPLPRPLTGPPGLWLGGGVAVTQREITSIFIWSPENHKQRGLWLCSYENRNHQRKRGRAGGGGGVCVCGGGGRGNLFCVNTLQ